YYYDWSDYFPPDLMKKFEKETGIKVTMDSFDSDAALQAKLQAGGGGYDVARPGDVKAVIDLGLIQPFDATTLPNFKYVKETFRHPWYDPDRKYSIPALWGTTGFIYDSAAIKGAPIEESWKEFFDPRPELVGKIGALDDEVVTWRTATYYLHIDECTEDPKDAEKVLALLLAQKPKLKL